ncbi:hypothetical protein OIDMADRAFT_20701, partial [Oidiodendron maius Zn]
SALANGRRDLALKCWIGVEYRLSQIAKADQGWRAAASTCWDSFLSSRMAQGTTYSC